MVYFEPGVGEGQRKKEWVQGGGRGSGGAFEGEAASEPALWVCSKMVAFHAFEGLLSFKIPAEEVKTTLR